MNERVISLFSAALPGLFAVVAGFQTVSAIGQETAKVTEETVTVAAPIERNTSGVATETIELTRQVTFADLDLTKHADVQELKTRIENTAKESCAKLEEMYPLPRNPSMTVNIRRCTQKAIADAAERVEEAIEAAK